MKLTERQRALEAQGWKFLRRNSKKKWVRITSNTNRQLAKAIAAAEGEAT